MRAIILHGHSRALSYVRYNRDGDLLFSTAREPTVCVWRTDGGALLGTYGVKGGSLPHHDGAVWHCAVTEDSMRLATAGADQQAIIWDVETGTPLGTIQAETPVKIVQFQPGDSNLLVVTDNAYGQTPAVTIHSLHDRKPMAPNPSTGIHMGHAKYENSARICHALWGPDGYTVYVAVSDGAIVLFDVRNTTRPVEKTNIHASDVAHICFSPDFAFLATCGPDQRARVLDAKDLTVIRTFDSAKPARCVAWHPTLDHILVGGGVSAADVTTTSHRSNRFEAKFFAVAPGEEIGIVGGHFGPVNTCEFHPLGGGFATGGEDGMIRLQTFPPDYPTA